MIINETKRAYKTTYTIQFPGHAGKVKEAAKRTEGVTFVSGTWMNGKAGGSNSYILELAQPSQDLCQAFLKNYKEVCQEAADARKAKTKLKVHPDFQAKLDALLPLK
jgi:hypothetical protein